MFHCIFWLFLFCLPLQAERVDLITHFLGDLSVEFTKVQKAGFIIRVGELSDYWRGLSPFSPELEKIIVFNPFQSHEALSQLPKDKLVLFVWEPVHPPFWYYDLFSRVYTWDDTLVDGKRFFKFYYPHLMPMVEDRPSFQEKKFCVMVTSNFTFERLKMIEFFEKKREGDFEFFGRAQGKLASYRMYRGPISGRHSGKEKIEVLKNYRFCICFENCHHLQGYVTEKIFGCFAAGCIPIYWGAINVEQYIPKDCFIDYRDFQGKEELYCYLKAMPEEVYDQYLSRIQTFLKSEKGYLFSPEHFDEIIYEAIVR